MKKIALKFLQLINNGDFHTISYIINFIAIPLSWRYIGYTQQIKYGSSPMLYMRVIVKKFDRHRLSLSYKTYL